MADARLMLCALPLCALSLGALGCTSEGTPMLLDQVCGQDYEIQGSPPACTVSGDAHITTGITTDAIAIELGENGGVFRIRLNAIPAITSSSFSLDVLAAASPLNAEGNILFRTMSWGTCLPSNCPPEPSDSEAQLEEDFAWAEMVKNVPGAQSFPDDSAFIELRGADIDIVDLRIPAYEGNYAY